MIVFILRRLWQSFFVLLTMSIIVFIGVYTIGNPVDILISRLRQKLKPHDFIKTIRGSGYCFVGKQP